MCEGLEIMTVRGSAFLFVGQNVYPLIEGIVPPTLHFYLKNGYIDIYGFWRVEGEEYAAYIRAALDKVHIVGTNILIEPHGTLENFDASVVIKLEASEKDVEELKKIINEEKFWTKEEHGEVVSTYLEKYLREKRKKK
ncbi:hypothetical protein [Thermococcus sibiricus]|nr:hypothetical protein [Thermococcus sibiricus]